MHLFIGKLWTKALRNQLICFPLKALSSEGQGERKSLKNAPLTQCRALFLLTSRALLKEDVTAPGGLLLLLRAIWTLCFPSERCLNGTSQIYHSLPDWGFCIPVNINMNLQVWHPAAERRGSDGTQSSAADSKKEGNATHWTPSPSLRAPCCRLSRFVLRTTVRCMGRLLKEESKDLVLVTLAPTSYVALT